MRSFRLNKDDLPELPIYTGPNYKIKSLESQKEALNTVKSKLDTEFSKGGFGANWKKFDPFKNEKEIVAKMGQTYNVSNAWLKCYEILCYYDLIPEDRKSIFHFDNAAFPGSFVVATHHFAATRRKLNYKWCASSLLDINDSNKSPLEDKYELYKRYPENWLMDTSNNGDVLIESNQLDFNKKIGGQIDLYTSDLGFDVSSDYNNQESLQLPANIGQIISGIATLKSGGCFVTKQYTYFEPMTVSVMYAAASLFDEFYVCKPYTSREANSETYLVGKGFKGSFDHSYVKAMLERIKADTKKPLFDAKKYPKEYLRVIIDSSKEISDSQAHKIDKDIMRVSECLAGKTKFVVDAFNDTEEMHLEKWYYDNPIYPIEKKYMLNMLNSYRQ